MTETEEKLVLDNLNLVRFVLNKYFSGISNRETWDDAFQEGCIGLMESVKKFNPDENSGCKFSTYAVKGIIFRVRSYFNKYNYDGSECRNWKDRDIVNSYLYSKSDDETDDEFCERLKISRNRLIQALNICHTISLDEAIMMNNKESTETVGSRIADPLTINGLDVTTYDEIMNHIDEIVFRVCDTVMRDNRQRNLWLEYITVRLFEIDKLNGKRTPESRLRSLGVKYGLSHQRVLQIVQKGLDKMAQIIAREYYSD